MGAMARDPRFMKAENLLFWWGYVVKNGDEPVNGYASESNISLLTASFSGSFGSKPLISGPINRDIVKIIDRMLRNCLSGLQYLACKAMFAPGKADWRERSEEAGMKKTKYFELKHEVMAMVVKKI